MSEHPFKVGDEVIVTEDANRLGGGRFKVAAIGRKLLHIVQYNRRRSFDLVTRKERGDGVGGSCYAYTPAEMERIKARADLCKRVEDVLGWGAARVVAKWSEERLTALVAVLEAA